MEKMARMRIKGQMKTAGGKPCTVDGMAVSEQEDGWRRQVGSRSDAREVVSSPSVTVAETIASAHCQDRRSTATLNHTVQHQWTGGGETAIDWSEQGDRTVQ